MDSHLKLICYNKKTLISIPKQLSLAVKESHLLLPFRNSLSAN